MDIRLANNNDLDSILKITDKAKNFLKNNNIPQWNNGYPNRDTFLEDISLNRLYVLDFDNKVIGFFALVYPDPNYDYIEGGKWESDSKYIAIHRLAIDDDYKGRGLSKEVFSYLKRHYNHLRVDTHDLNKVMNNAIKANGFKYAGIVYMADSSKRNAYQWLLEYEEQ